MPSLSRSGAVLNYEVWGDSGPWITMLSGHTRPLNDYRMLGRHLAGRGWRSLALDNRGAGQTATERPFTFAEMVDDVVALWDETGISRTAVLGISMGGFLAQALAMQAGGRISGLILVSTAGNQRRIVRDDRPWTDDPDQVAAKLAPYFTEDFAQRHEVLVRSMAKQIARNVAVGGFAAKSDWQRQAVAAFAGVGSVPQPQVPVRIIHGDSDSIIPYEAAVDLASTWPGAELIQIQSAGHLLLAEKPQELYQHVSSFLATLP